ncbi:MAG: tRNA pseudouridine(55) synthase TruB [Clostridia bacterium]|nr:tRNA pseudouridine(55) synthase TruB [Clostridia bacterium]
MKTPSHQGIVPIFKPSGMTSSAVTAKIKRFLGKKTGHFGTLDPMASGVLPVMLGGATKLSEYMPETKEYTAVLKLGYRTDTGDVTGKTVATADIPALTRENIEKVLLSFMGEIMQTPPIYSALSVNGKRLYEYAVRGEEVEIKSRPITIYDIELVNFKNDEITFKVNCGKGTYIRTLCEDIAKKLGTEGTMSALERTLSGGIQKENCVDFDEFISSDDPYKYVIPPSEYLSFYPAVNLNKTAVSYYKNGGEINSERAEGLSIGIFRVFFENTLLGLGKGYCKEEKLYLKAVWHCIEDENQ